MIELHQWQTRRKRGHRMRALAVQAKFGHHALDGVPPIVEVTRHHHGVIGRNFTLDERPQLRDLSAPTAGQQTQVNDEDVQGLFMASDFNMKQSALLQSVVRDVLVLMPHHWPTREQGIAVLAVPRERIGSVDHGVAQRRQKLRLWHFRPMRKATRLAPVEAPDFLQTHNVGIQLLHGMPQVVNLQALRGPQALNPFVNVVSGNAQQTHACILSHVRRKA